jgi:hypothetical protein
LQKASQQADAFETDLKGIKVDVANNEVFTEATTLMINQATCCLSSPSASPPVSGNARGEFPHFSGYMGTTIPLQESVLVTTWSQILLKYFAVQCTQDSSVGQQFFYFWLFR